MGEVNSALGKEGHGQVVRALGREFVLKPPTQSCYAEYERWLERHARDKLRESREYLPPEEYEEDRITLLRDINTFQYSWGKPLCKASLVSVEGGLEWAAILLRQTTPKADAALARKIIEDAPDEFADALKIVVETGDRVRPNAEPTEPKTKD